MHVVDLFAGTGSATKHFQHDPRFTTTLIDSDEHKDYTDIDIVEDILHLNGRDLGINQPVLVWASPPCTKFSIASAFSKGYWEKEDVDVDGFEPSKTYMPQTEETMMHFQLAVKTLHLIAEMRPTYWFMENPRGVMRKALWHEPGNGLGRKDKTSRSYGRGGTVTYCQYGDNRMKPTDLWGVHPDGFEYRWCNNGDDCHDASPRGSKTGTQGLDKVERSMIPDGLAYEVYRSVCEGVGVTPAKQS